MEKTHPQISGMNEAGRIACLVLDRVEEFLSSNATSKTCLEVDKLCDEEIRKHGGIPECIGYPGPSSPYKHASCVSPNNIVCHGVPNDYELKKGDIVNVDIVVRKGEWLADTSRTFPIGEVSKVDRLLLAAAEGAMYAGMTVVEPGASFRLVGYAIDRYVKLFNKRNGVDFFIVPDLCSHGISRTMHEGPSIIHTPNAMREIMNKYQTFTIEPIISSQRNIKFTESTEDGWSLVAKGEAKTAQWEHTVYPDESIRILTARDKAHEEEILAKVAKVREILLGKRAWENFL